MIYSNCYRHSQFATYLAGLVAWFIACGGLFGMMPAALAQEAVAPVQDNVATVQETAAPANPEQPSESKAEPKTEPLQGHSYHGEVFNEGPRQAAYLMEGMPKINFPTTTSSPEAQQFINQGVAQLHGFWYYEAERSFRQAAKLDPDCAIAYWGMAMANGENLKRARGFIDQANERKPKASRREQLYIEAYEKFCRETEGDDKEKKIPSKTRAKKYTEGLEEIVLEFPDDIEAKAFLVGQLWANERSELPIVGHVAVNALIQQIFDADPMHPAHHYRIHLWDYKKAEQALASAAQCGPCSPGIAHMWHMPGHIYSKLHRYHDACWQQEASARVDHAHMIRDRVMPDQIHNFAHNNEWLIRNMIKVGRVHDAISLAKNMIELPRHTKYNSTKKSGSAKYGRERLFQTLSAYHLWDQIIELSSGVYLPDEPDDEDLHLHWSRYVGVARALGQNADAPQPILDELKQRAEKVQASLAELDAADKKAEEESKPKPEAPPTEPAPSTIQQLASSPADAPVENAPAENTQVEIPAPAASGGCDAPSDAEEQKKKAEDDKKKRDEERKKLEESQKKIDKTVNTIKAAQCAAQHRWFEAVELAEKGDELDLLACEWRLASGDYEKAIEAAKKKVADQPGELLSQALVSWIEFQHGGVEAAKESFERVRATAARADIETPPLRRLRWLATALGYDHDWRLPYQPASDIGQRPNLDSLGPYRWHPYQLPEFVVKDAQGIDVSSRELDRPTLVIFYLGFGCLHCVEQLKAVSPRVVEISNLGIDLIAISMETPEQMATAVKNYDKPLEIPLYTDPQLQAFKAMHCFDDFENQPLHGLFLVKPGAENKPAQVLWQDIGFEPFMDIDFVLKESQRLLQLTK